MELFSKYDLLCRADFDGLVAASLLKQKERVSSVRFVCSQDVADGAVKLWKRHILVNLPWRAEVKRTYDHRPQSELLPRRITAPNARSTSRVVWEHFGGARAFPKFSEEIVAAVDKFSSATYTKEDVETPQGWELLSFLLDPGTGLSRLGAFHLSHFDLLAELVDLLPGRSAQQVIAHPELVARSRLYAAEQFGYREQILRTAQQLEGGLLLLDYRSEEQIHVGNRYLAYALFPESRVSLSASWGFMKERVSISMGRSIFAPCREQNVDVGALMRNYGGGGHSGAGKCSVKSVDFERVFGEIAAEVARVSQSASC